MPMKAAKANRKAATCRRTPKISKLAPAVGFEPTTNRLTADRSTTELRWIAYCSKNRQTHFAHSRSRGKFQSRDRPRRAGSSRAVAKTALSRARLLSARLMVPVSRESKKLGSIETREDSRGNSQLVGSGFCSTFVSEKDARERTA